MDLKEVTEKVNRLSEELEKLRPLKPEDEQRVMQKFRLDWNYNSNNIEGNTLTYGETKALLLFGITAQGKPLKDHLEVEGHNEAIDKIIEVARNNEPLTEAFIRNIHKIILHESYEIDAITADGQPTTKRVEIGKYKTTPNHVKTITGEIFYFTSPQDTPAKMEELMNWYKENLINKEIHSLMFAVEFHHRFIRIHPFDDGNGRMARLLMNLLLMQKGFPPVIVKVKDKEDYYSVLHLADSGNLEPFYIFIGTQLIHSLEIIVNAAKGEDIEEPEDVDKEIALLEKKLKVENELVEIEKSEESVSNIIQTSVIPLFVEFISQLQKLKKFYSTVDIILNIDNSLIPLQNENTVFSFKTKLVKDIKNEISVLFQFKNFKTAGINIFHDSANLKFSFADYIYYIYCDSNTPIQKLYHQNLSSEEIKKIPSEILKSHVTHIKSNTDK